MQVSDIQRNDIL